MRNEIQELVRKNKSVGFDDLWADLRKTYPELTKGSLAQNIRSLASEYKIIDVNRRIYDPNQLEKAKGFVHWNVGKLCWIESTDKTNDFGIAFNGNSDLLTVANKREALYGSEVAGFLLPEIEGGKEQTFYITERINMKHVTLFAILDTKENVWQVLNSNGGIIINTEFLSSNGFNNGDVIEIDSLDFNKCRLYGNISDKGIESRMIQTLSDITIAPEMNGNANADLEKLSLNAPLMDVPFYTIDSIYTKDIDDAIWCKKNDDGTFSLKVAIADVSTYVKPGDELDAHAMKACTSFYFYNNTTHMLSKELAEKYCSLNVAEERGSMVCSLEIAANGEIENVQFSHNKIRSNARLTYDDVNRILEGVTPIESLVLENGAAVTYKSNKVIEDSLKDLYELSRVLHKEYNPDYWFVPSPEIEINEFGKVKSLYLEQRDTSKSQIMVEGAMLCANKAAAKFLFNHNIDTSALFRNQVAPTEEFERPEPAQYAAINDGHWGLQAEHYTHFTSPIRRYCDLVVHRMIKAAISNEPTYTKEQLEDIAKNINEQQYKNKVCNKREANLLTNQYVSRLVETGEISNKYKIVDYSEAGVVFRNNQLVDLFVPTFKVDRKLSKTIEEMIANDLKPTEKKAALEALNNDFRFKCFIDSYNWITDRKEIGFKIYPRDAEEAQAISEQGKKPRIR